MNSAGPKDGRVPDARAAALDLLGSVLDRGTPLDIALTQSAAVAELPPRDRAFTRLLVTTVLRRRGQIDAAIDEKLSRPLAKRQHQVRNALRLGIAQLAFLGTPAHAAVDSSVGLVRRRGRAGMSGLVNAVCPRAPPDRNPVGPPRWGADAIVDQPQRGSSSRSSPR